MTTPDYAAELERRYALYEKRRHESLRPRVPLPEQLAARRHECDLAEGRRRRSDRRVDLLIGAWLLAVAVAIILRWLAGVL